MSLQFERLLYGYIHKIERRLSITIPDLITTIKYQFECFTLCGKAIEIDDGGNIAFVGRMMSKIQFMVLFQSMNPMVHLNIFGNLKLINLQVIMNKCILALIIQINSSLMMISAIVLHL